MNLLWSLKGRPIRGSHYVSPPPENNSKFDLNRPEGFSIILIFLELPNSIEIVVASQKH